MDRRVDAERSLTDGWHVKSATQGVTAHTARRSTPCARQGRTAYWGACRSPISPGAAGPGRVWIRQESPDWLNPVVLL